MQRGLSLDFHLQRYYGPDGAAFHYFNNLDQLATLCRRFAIDAVVIGGDRDSDLDIELLRAIKSNVFLAVIPVIVYHPDPSENLIIEAYETGVEEFIHHEWREKLVEVRVRKVIERSRRDMATNPSTRLPGPTIIERELVRQIELASEFAVCYADLDNFKAYNDYYGYYFGDKVIRLTARIIKDAVFDVCPEGFVGHVAGDDFVVIIPPDLIDSVCAGVIKTFDALIPYSYKEEDRLRGNITTTNRRGVMECFPLLTISIAVVSNRNSEFEHVGELSKMLADLKTATKQKSGSNYMMERRRKY